MTRNRMSKLSASLIVLVMAMSALVFLPSEGGTGQTVKTNVIEVPVQDTSGFFVSSATVDLTNVHNGAAIRATLTTPGLYHADNVPAGIYRIDVVAGEYYDNHTVIVNFTAYSSLVTPTVLLKTFGSKSHTWTVTVQKASDGTSISGATVGFFDCKKNETVASTTSNSTGVAVVSMFTTQPTDKFVLYAKAAGYNTTYEQLVVSGSGSRSWSLDASKRVTGYVKNWAGTSLLNNVVGYMISNDTSLPQIARVLKSASGGKSFEFDAFPGDFVMLVDADNGSAYVSSIRISASGSYAFDDFRLKDQIRRTEQVSVVFGTDYQGFTLAVDATWSYDEAHPSLLYGEVGSLRMQIDLAVGDGDGMVSQSEIDKFDNVLRNIGSQYITSSGLVQVNDSLFDPGAVTGYVMDLTPGSVISETGVHYAYSCPYTKHSAIPVGSSDYSVSLTARYDSYEVDYRYSVTPTSSFELVSNQSTSLVSVLGYSVVSINPAFVAAGGQEPVALILEKSVKPIAKAGIVDGAFAHAVYSGGNVTRYLVAIDENVTLTAFGSDDPNNNPLTYSWNFGDSTPIVNTSDLTTVHKFTIASLFTVNLTVTDVVGLENWSNIAVYCDGLAPHPVIAVKDKTVTSGSIAVNQREVVWFNATSSTDDALATDDRLGVIDHVMFDWGDGNVSLVIQWTADQQNTSKSWEKSGTYNVTLNVTDVVGHWFNTTMSVKVNDTEAPKVAYVIRNDTWEASYIENQTLHFDANGTTDNVDAMSDLNFSWEFADGTWFNGTGAEGAWNVTHIYNSTGAFNMALNVTDKTGNFKVERKLITVLSGPRPDLRIERVYYDPLDFTEGKSGFILVNVTNKGSRNAENISISFYVVTGDGTQKAIMGTGTLWVNDTQVSIIEPGQTGQYKLAYTPGSKGTFIIRVNVTCDNQLRPYSFTASPLIVKPAPWKQWALWGGVLAIVVLVPLLLMFRGRLAKREKKGPRRERKEKEKEKVSDEEL